MRKWPLSLMNLRLISGGTSARPIVRGLRLFCRRWKLVTKSLWICRCSSVSAAVASSRSVWRSLMISRPMSSAVRTSWRWVSPAGASPPAMVKRRCSVSSAATSRPRSSGVMGPRRTGATIGAKSAMTLRFSACWSGISSSAESISDTVFRRRNAACLALSSSSVSALDIAAKPERPEVARIFFSHTTDSVPRACRLSRL